jgi:hypothetical protein
VSGRLNPELERSLEHVSSRRRPGLELFGRVAAEMHVDPTLSATEIWRRLGASRTDVLYCVREVRKIQGVPSSARGPGRPRKTVLTSAEDALGGDAS